MFLVFLLVKIIGHKKYITGVGCFCDLFKLWWLLLYVTSESPFGVILSIPPH